MSDIIDATLAAFQVQQQIAFQHFGAICTMIFVTRQARRFGLPLTPGILVSRHGGQVAGF